MTPEHVEQISNAKILISQLYARLNIGEHQVSAEKDLQKELEGLKVELAPLQMVCSAIITFEKFLLCWFFLLETT